MFFLSPELKRNVMQSCTSGGGNSKPQKKGGKNKEVFFFSLNTTFHADRLILLLPIKIGGGNTTTRKDRISDPKGLRRFFILPFRELPPPSFVAGTEGRKSWDSPGPDGHNEKEKKVIKGWLPTKMVASGSNSLATARKKYPIDNYFRKEGERRYYETFEAKK
jgi:hypothetical protein